MTIKYYKAFTLCAMHSALCVLLIVDITLPGIYSVRQRETGGKVELVF
jgi:hypothetical protein